jgi:type IV secretory pathway VirB10-like protein
MPISDTLKNDIRVRDRLLRKNQLTQDEVERQDAALLDVEDKAVVLELKQPALQKESERAIDGPRISRPAPAARPAPIRPFEEEDDEEVLDPKAKLKAAAVADEEEDEDEEDEEDEDEDDEGKGNGDPA